MVSCDTHLMNAWGMKLTVLLNKFLNLSPSWNNSDRHAVVRESERKPSKSKFSTSSLSFKGLRKSEAASDKRSVISYMSRHVTVSPDQGWGPWSRQLCGGGGLHRHGQELHHRPGHGGRGEGGGGARACDGGVSAVHNVYTRGPGVTPTCLGGHGGLGGQALWQRGHIPGVSHEYVIEWV